jgi:thiamine biosynthesis lipoprotein
MAQTGAPGSTPMLAADLLGSRDGLCGPVHKARSYVFGTLAEITIYSGHGWRAAHLASTVLDDFDRLHWLLHAWKDSALSTLNRAIAAGERDIRVKPELARLIRDATEFSQRSHGLFNPAIGRLVRLWNFHASEFVPVAPKPLDVQRVLDASPRMTDLTVDGCTVNCTNRYVQLDFGGYAKGYALDRAIRFLRRKDLTGALVNIGGNIMALGLKGAQPWRIGIQHPRKPGPIAWLPLCDGEAISTSGDYERYFMLNGNRYSHLIDPRTGRPACGIQSATVVVQRGACSGTLSDASSGPLFIQGADDWRKLTRQLGVTLAMLIDERGDTHLTDEIRDRLEFV